MSEQAEYDFGFAFADGFKWSHEMSREELLVVIQTLILERDHAKRDFRKMAELAGRIIPV